MRRRESDRLKKKKEESNEIKYERGTEENKERKKKEG